MAARPPACALPAAGGSVARSGASSRVPITSSTMLAPMAPHVTSEMASSVASGGPATNTTSSTTDSNANAVRTSFGSSSTCAHRARASDPKLGTSASPIANETNHVHTGASISTSTTKVSWSVTAPVTTSGSTRCWL